MAILDGTEPRPLPTTIICPEVGTTSGLVIFE